MCKHLDERVFRTVPCHVLPVSLSFSRDAQLPRACVRPHIMKRVLVRGGAFFRSLFLSFSCLLSFSLRRPWVRAAGGDQPAGGARHRPRGAGGRRPPVRPPPPPRGFSQESEDRERRPHGSGGHECNLSPPPHTQHSPISTATPVHWISWLIDPLIYLWLWFLPKITLFVSTRT